jgi:hypothetical protein
MATIKFPIIKESEYELFRGIGVTNEFPPDFSAFLERMEQENKSFTDKGIITIETNINFASFRLWFGVGRYACNSDLFNYAAIITNGK